MMEKRISIAVMTMGFSGLVAEILLLREFLIIFSGNEFSIGIVLANWLILEAFGSFCLGRIVEKSKNTLETFTTLTLLFSISLLLAIYLIRILKGMMGISIGESIGFLPMFYSSFLILLPVSVIHGALFTFSCHIYSMFSAQDASSTGRVYAYETLGMVIGGIASTYLIIPYLDTFQASSGLAVLNSGVCLAMLTPQWKTGPYQKITLIITCIITFLFGILTIQAHKLHTYSIAAQWKNQDIVHYQNSQYGNICVIENEGQYIFFQDGIPNIITPIPDIPFVEEFVHLPLLAHPEPKKLLILSGGSGGVINEALKHPSIDTIEYAELDPLIIDLFQKFPTPLTESELNDRRVKIKHIDGRLLLATTQNKYDLIFIGVTEPSNLQINRFYTKEFFSLARGKLNEHGILVLGLSGSLSFATEELQNLNSSIFHTLKSVFPYVRAIPGYGTNLFLLSDSPEIISLEKTQIISKLDQRDIKTNVIVPWHIEQTLHPGWQDWFYNFIEGSSQKINSDLYPIGVFYSVSHWNALFAPSIRWLFELSEKISLQTTVLFFVIFLLLYFIVPSRRKRFFRGGILLAIFTTGFAGMIFDLMLIFTFQSIYGHVFSWIGLLVASFMAGAACGAMLVATVMDRIKDCYKFFLRIELAIICFSIGCLLIFYFPTAKLWGLEAFFLSRTLFLVISFIGGYLVGSQFPLANKLYLGDDTSITKTAGTLYSADLLGGWLGGVLGAVVLLPVLGLVGTCITVGLLKLTSFIVINSQSKLYPRGGKNEYSS
jgi:spermidine synthase